MADLTPERQQQLRRRHMHERQAVLFGSIVALMAIAALGSAAVYTGVLSVPLLEREFSTPEAATVDDVPEPPCPPAGAMPVAYTGITVNVLNGSDRNGLANQTATDLAALGFVIGSTGDYPTTLPTAVQLNFGEGGIPSAYTLAASLDSPVMVLDTRTDFSVDVVLGETFTGLLDPTMVVLDPAAPLEPPPSCVPLELALADAVPAPAAEQPAEESTEAPADGGEGFEEETTPQDEPAPPAP